MTERRPWTEVIDNAIRAFRSGDYVYLYGAKNVRITSPIQVQQYFNQEPAYYSRYSADEKAQIVKNSVGHMAADCSGFTGWVCTGDKQYSVGQINNCSKYNTIPAGPTASILFTTFGGTGRHIGLDVGGTGTGTGLCMHMGYESTDKNIREGKAGIIFEPIANRAWEKSGQSNVVSYAGVYSPYQPILDLWNEIHGGPMPTPTFHGWVGEVYGKSIVPVYQGPAFGQLLPDYPHLALGNLFEVIGENGTFLEIRIAQKYIGWIEKKYCLRKTPYKDGKVTTDLHLRKGAGATYKSLTVMPKGSVIQICDQKPAADGRPWDYVFYRGQYGFCSDRYVK